MIDINNLFNGNPLNFFIEALGGTFLGEWIYLLLFLSLTFTVAIKTRNFEITGIMSLILLYLIKDVLPFEGYITTSIISMIAISYSLWRLFAHDR